MANSVKTNYIFNFINSITQVLLPLITFPYASRILLPDGIGHVNSFISIINVVILCTSLGIPLYAVKEVSRLRNNIRQLNLITIEILSLHSLLTLLGYVIVGLLCIFIPQINADISLFLLLSLSIVFTTIGCEWFYQAVEDFKYITIRGVIIRLLSIIFLFVFVKTKEDIMWYAAFTVLGILGSNIFNFFRLSKYLKLQYLDFRRLKPLKHLQGVIKIFAFNVVTSVYVQLNTVFLSFSQSDMAAGYYTAALKLNLTALLINYSLSNVMLPRLNNLIATGNKEKFEEMAQKSYDFTFALTLPMAIGLIFISPYAVILLSGQAFSPSIIVSQIMSFTIFFIGLSNVLGIQMLFPLGYMSKVIFCVCVGCVADILLCLFFIPSMSQDGAAIAYLMAEMMVTICLFFVGRKVLPLKYFKKSYFIYILASIIMSILLFVESYLHLNYIVKLFVMIITGMVIYIVILFIFNEPLTMRIREIIDEKFGKRK